MSNMGISDALTSIKIEAMNLTVFPIFSNATGIKELSVLSNYFTSIPDEYIKNFISLTLLKIQYCLLEVMPNLSHMDKLGTIRSYAELFLYITLNLTYHTP